MQNLQLICIFLHILEFMRNHGLKHKKSLAVLVRIKRIKEEIGIDSVDTGSERISLYEIDPTVLNLFARDSIADGGICLKKRRIVVSESHHPAVHRIEFI